MTRRARDDLKAAMAEGLLMPHSGPLDRGSGIGCNGQPTASVAWWAEGDVLAATGADMAERARRLRRWPDMNDISALQIIGIIAVLAAMIAFWIFGSRFGTEGRNNPRHFTDADDDGAPDVPQSGAPGVRPTRDADDTEGRA